MYAEDSFAGFLPQAGTTSSGAVAVRACRVDHALESGQVVSTSYDPMLGKIIAHGPDRETARLALVAGARRHRDPRAHHQRRASCVRWSRATSFRDATIDTAWLDRHEVPAPDHELPRVMAAWVSAMLSASDTGHPFQHDGFRLGAPPAPIVVELDREVVVDRHAGAVDGVPVRQLSAADHVLELDIDGRTVRAVVNVQPDIVEVACRASGSCSPGRDRLGDHARAVGDGTCRGADARHGARRSRRGGRPRRRGPACWA